MEEDVDCWICHNFSAFPIVLCEYEISKTGNGSPAYMEYLDFYKAFDKVTQAVVHKSKSGGSLSA